MAIKKTRDGSFKLSSLCKGGDYLLFRFRPRYKPGHRHDEVSILPVYVKKRRQFQTVVSL